MKRVLGILILCCCTSIISWGKPRWNLWLDSSKFDINNICYSTSAYDQQENIFYALGRGHVFRINLNTKTVDSVPLKNPPEQYCFYTFDFTNKRILCGKNGKNATFAIDVNNGIATKLSNGIIDYESQGCAYYWNDYAKRMGYFGGYGYYKVNNWVYEINENNEWINIIPNSDNCKPAKRVNPFFILGKPGTHTLLLYSGSGNCSGDQFEKTCTEGVSIPTDVGSFCWLRDAYFFDYKRGAFIEILPPHTRSITQYGSCVYDYNKNRLFIVGGTVPGNDNPHKIDKMFTTNILYYDIGKSKAFRKMDVNPGNLSPCKADEYPDRCAFYDGIKKRIIWIRKEGIWELPLGK